MIDPKRSQFKKLTKDYKKDGLFDIIDIQAELAEDKLIPKVNIEEFMYTTELKELQEIRKKEIYQSKAKFKSNTQIS